MYRDVKNWYTKDVKTGTLRIISFLSLLHSCSAYLRQHWGVCNSAAFSTKIEQKRIMDYTIDEGVCHSLVCFCVCEPLCEDVTFSQTIDPPAIEVTTNEFSFVSGPGLFFANPFCADCRGFIFAAPSSIYDVTQHFSINATRRHLLRVAIALRIRSTALLARV